MAKQRNRARLVLLVTGILAVVVVGVVAWEELVAWHAVWRDFERLGKNEQGRSEYRHLPTGILFVRLPGGTFDMGSPETEPGRADNEGPVHRVTLSSFLIAKYEVSQAEWQKVMGLNPGASKRGDTLAVESVSWEDCQEFCEKTKLSLPTEAQWEYACRAGTSRPFAGTGKVDEMAWVEENSGRQTHPVGEKKANDFGLHDMHGNVWEWCADWYQADFYRESSGAKDPLCENSDSEYRVVHGGSWFFDASACRSACRNGLPPGMREVDLGFRLAWSSP